MSNDPHSDNPYQSTYGYGSGYGYGQQGYLPSDPSGLVKGPAICLIVLCSLWLLITVAALIFNIVLLVAGPMGLQDPDEPRAQRVAGIIGAVLYMVANGCTLYGSVRMLQLRNYAMAMTAGVLSVLPCCSACWVLGIPFGIWALVVLNRPDVRQAFRD
jgi:hypothetical protein